MSDPDITIRTAVRNVIHLPNESIGRTPRNSRKYSLRSLSESSDRSLSIRSLVSKAIHQLKDVEDSGSSSHDVSHHGTPNLRKRSTRSSPLSTTPFDYADGEGLQALPPPAKGTRSARRNNWLQNFARDLETIQDKGGNPDGSLHAESDRVLRSGPSKRKTKKVFGVQDFQDGMESLLKSKEPQTSGTSNSLSNLGDDPLGKKATNEPEQNISFKIGARLTGSTEGVSSEQLETLTGGVTLNVKNLSNVFTPKRMSSRAKRNLKSKTSLQEPVLSPLLLDIANNIQSPYNRSLSKSGDNILKNASVTRSSRNKTSLQEPALSPLLLDIANRTNSVSRPDKNDSSIQNNVQSPYNRSLSKSGDNILKNASVTRSSRYKKSFENIKTPVNNSEISINNDQENSKTNRRVSLSELSHSERHIQNRDSTPQKNSPEKQRSRNSKGFLSTKTSPDKEYEASLTRRRSSPRKPRNVSTSDLLNIADERNTGKEKAAITSTTPTNDHGILEKEQAVLRTPSQSPRIEVSPRTQSQNKRSNEGNDQSPQKNTSQNHRSRSSKGFLSIETPPDKENKANTRRRSSPRKPRTAVSYESVDLLSMVDGRNTEKGKAAIASTPTNDHGRLEKEQAVVRTPSQHPKIVSSPRSPSQSKRSNEGNVEMLSNQDPIHDIQNKTSMSEKSPVRRNISQNLSIPKSSNRYKKVSVADRHSPVISPLRTPSQRTTITNDRSPEQVLSVARAHHQINEASIERPMPEESSTRRNSSRIPSTPKNINESKTLPTPDKHLPTTSQPRKKVKKSIQSKSRTDFEVSNPEIAPGDHLEEVETDVVGLSKPSDIAAEKELPSPSTQEAQDVSEHEAEDEARSEGQNEADAESEYMSFTSADENILDTPNVSEDEEDVEARAQEENKSGTRFSRTSIGGLGRNSMVHDEDSEDSVHDMEDVEHEEQANVKKPKKRTVRTKETELPRAVKKFAECRFRLRSRYPVHKDSIDTVVSGVIDLLKVTAEEAQASAQHAKRKTIFPSDINLFMKRIGFINSTCSRELLIMKYMPYELQWEMIPYSPAYNVLKNRFR